jgi:hypothetical protein
MRSVLAALLVSGVALAQDKDPLIHFSEPVSIESGSKTAVLPPGYFLTNRQFDVLDAEVQRLQSAEVALKSQNDNLGELLAKRPAGFGLKGAVVFMLAGAALGATAVFLVTR